MARRPARQRYPREVAERIRITAALARERVLEKHVASALEAVAEGAGRVPVERLLSIYARLHALEGPDERQLGERVLAALGRRADLEWAHQELSAPRSPWRRLVRRLRGRVDLEFRDWLDRHVARVQLELLDLHVSHALEFVRIADGHLRPARAIQTYAEELRLRPTPAEMVRLMTLRALDVGRLAGRTPALRTAAAPPPPLRVADGGS